MSQHINLLPVVRRACALSAQRAVLVLALWLLAWLGMALAGRQEVTDMTQAAANTTRQRQEQQAMLKALQKQLGQSDAATDIASQIAALEPRTRVAEDVLARLKNGELGSLQGYDGQLTTLASIAQPGVWLTAIHISNAGRALRVEGRALQKEQVLRYAQTLNSDMQAYAAQFAQVEIAPVLPAPGANPGSAPVFSFRLY